MSSCDQTRVFQQAMGFLVILPKTKDV